MDMVSYLILDDSNVIRKVARRIIEDLGCQVTDAADGFEAMQICRHGMPDAIIIDWIMPNMSGTEFIAEFKATFGQVAPNTKLIYCTHEMNIPEMAKAKRAGATHFIMKPFNKQILKEKLTGICITQIEEAA
jgi:two-component system chemotaxis response regulator CheY